MGVKILRYTGSVPNDYHVLVRASVGGSFKGDIAIDDLALSSKVCNDSGTQVSASVPNADCNFDTGLCLWTQSTSDSFNWLRHRGPTTSSATGPSGDHTSSGGNGYYIYTEASSQNHGQKADLLSPKIPGGSDYCLSMFTNMYGNSMGSIAVYTMENGQKQLKATYSQKDSVSVWRPRYINLGQHTHPFQIIIEGMIGVSYSSDAAIDDIIVRSGRCI